MQCPFPLTGKKTSLIVLTQLLGTGCPDGLYSVYYSTKLASAIGNIQSLLFMAETSYLLHNLRGGDLACPNYRYTKTTFTLTEDV